MNRIASKQVKLSIHEILQTLGRLNQVRGHKLGFWKRGGGGVGGGEGGLISGGYEAEGRETYIFGVLRLRGGKPIFWGVGAEGRETQFLRVVNHKGNESNIMFGYWGGGEAEGTVHMLKWDCAHTQLEACACTTGSVLIFMHA